MLKERLMAAPDEFNNNSANDFDDEKASLKAGGSTSTANRNITSSTSYGATNNDYHILTTPNTKYSPKARDNNEGKNLLIDNHPININNNNYNINNSDGADQPPPPSLARRMSSQLFPNIDRQQSVAGGLTQQIENYVPESSSFV